MWVTRIVYDDWEERHPGTPSSFQYSYPDAVILHGIPGGGSVRIERNKKLHEIDESDLPNVPFAKSLAACDVTLAGVIRKIEYPY